MTFVEVKTVDGVVWLTIDVDQKRVRMGAVEPGKWVVTLWGPHSALKRIAEEFEREHAAEIAPLFEIARGFRSDISACAETGFLRTRPGKTTCVRRKAEGS